MPMVDAVPRILVFFGLLIAAIGALLWLGQLLPPAWRPGHLPGDIIIRREGLTFYLPLTTMVLVSLLASGALVLVRWLGR